MAPAVAREGKAPPEAMERRAGGAAEAVERCWDREPAPRDPDGSPCEVVPDLEPGAKPDGSSGPRESAELPLLRAGPAADGTEAARPRSCAQSSMTMSESSRSLALRRGAAA